jgi:hypothetical protein
MVKESQLRTVTSIRGEAVKIDKVVYGKKRNYIIFKFRDGRKTEIDFEKDE